MMKLADAASFFDRTPCLHPNTGVTLFYGQVDPYDDSKRDAGAAYRRVLSVAPGTAMPAGLAVRIFGQVWLIGNKETDGLEAAHRDKYVLQQAAREISISRLPAYLAGTAASSAWSAVEWLKDGKELEVSSDAVQTYNVVLPATADVREHDVLWYTGRALLVSGARAAPSGFKIATCLELEQVAPAAATVTARTFDPAAGAYTDGSPVTVQCLRVRWQSLFLYGSQADARYQESDCSLVLPAATSVSTSSSVTLAGVTYSVLSTDSIASAVVVHARPA